MLYYDTLRNVQMRQPVRGAYKLLQTIDAEIQSEVDNVFQHGAIKHGERWRQQTSEHHYNKALGHMDAWYCGETLEADSGFHHLAHAMVRLYFAWKCRAKEQEGNG